MGVVRWFFLLCLGVVSAPLAVHSAESERLRIAVDEFRSEGLSASEASVVTDRLRSELINTRRFRVMERGQMDAVLNEQGFSQSGACSTDECMVKVGQLLSVDRFVVGRVGRFGTLLTLNARVLDVSTGEILYSANEDYKGSLEGLLTEGVPNLARKLAQSVGAGQAAASALPRAGIGDLFVSSRPVGAQVWLDGSPVQGSTPLTLSGIASGRHALRLRKGDWSETAELELAPDELKKVEVALALGKGSIKVFTTPPGVKVYLDSVLQGSSPLKIDSVGAGGHQLSFEGTHVFPRSRTVRVLGDSIMQVSETLDSAWSLGLDIRPASATVTLDGNPFIPWPGAVLVKPGPLLVQIEKDGYTPYEDKIVLDRDMEWSVDLKKPLMDVGPEHSLSTRRKVALALWGGTLVSAGASYWFVSKGDDYQDDFDSAVLRRDAAEVRSASDNLDKAESYYGASVGVALVSGVAGLMLWFWPE